MSIGQSKATEVKPEDVNVTFKDVGGADEAIEEPQDIIQFLKEPEQFSKLGGRIPKGCALSRPSGDRKTLLQKQPPGKHMFRSLKQADRNLSKCSSESVPQGFEISSIRHEKSLRNYLYR